MKEFIMKLIMFLIFLIYSAFAQFNFKPTFGFSLYEFRKEIIHDVINNDVVYFRNASGENKGGKLCKESKLIDYDVSIGFEIHFKKLYMYSDNIIQIETKNFLVNIPYNIDFKIGLKYVIKNFTFSIEHLCGHPIYTEITTLVYQQRKAYTRFSFEYKGE